MQVTVQDVSPVEKRIAVDIEWPMVAAKLDEAYKELGRVVTIKGFRKGKVPRSILEKMFARKVEQEVQQKLVQETFVRAAQQNEINPVAEPVVDDMTFEKGASFRYSARVEIRQAFEPVDYEGVKLEKGKPEVSDEEIEQALRHKREELTEYKKIEGRETLGRSDVVFVDVDGEVGAHKVKREGLMIDLSGNGSTEGIPGLAAALVGLPIGAKDQDLSFTVPHEAEGSLEATHAEVRDAVGHPAKLKVSVREAREKLVPDLDDDFAKDTGEADSLDELKGKLKEKLSVEKEKNVERDLRNELVKEVLRKNPFQVAPALVDRQLEQMIRVAKLQMMMRGVDPKNMRLDEDKLKEGMRAEAIDEVRALFLIDAIATKEKVEVSEADLEKKLSEMAAQRDKNVARLKAELQKEGKFDNLKHQLREEKTLDLLMSRANITTKS